MQFSPNITKRERTRKLLSGVRVKQVRYVVSYKDPRTRRRRQEFFARQGDAASRRAELITQVANGSFVDRRTTPTVNQAIDHWLASREGQVKTPTLAGYKQTVQHIRGPLIVAPPKDRAEITIGRATAAGLRTIPMLGDLKVCDVTPGHIRAWHKTLAEFVGIYTAHRCKAHLKTILSLVEEDFGVRAPPMPTNLSRARQRRKKAILAPAQVQILLAGARQDLTYGVYYAFPFLAGTRPSEQLGLLWEDVDFEANVLRIRRVQERDGSLTDTTKTEAGTREVPMGPVLREMLLAWQERCPRRPGEPQRVFPGLGRLQPWPMSRKGGGGPLLYQNFRKRVWAPRLRKLGIPYVTPHSARHSYISIMQAQGVEVGLVAQLAGHSNAAVTLGHYTQAVRGGQDAVARLETAYGAGG